LRERRTAPVAGLQVEARGAAADRDAGEEVGRRARKGILSALGVDSVEVARESCWSQRAPWRGSMPRESWRSKLLREMGEREREREKTMTKGKLVEENGLNR
jgi:hypothetical protein